LKPLNNGLTSTGVLSLAVNNTIIFAGSNGGVYRSYDRASTWTQVNNGLTSSSILTIAVSGTDLFAGTNVGVFRSSDSGSSWRQVNTGFSNPVNPVVWSLAVNGANIFAGTDGGSGVWKRPLSEMIIPVAIRPSHESQAEIGFGRNFGNLIRPGTRFEFVVTYPSAIEISVYDAKGKKAATLVKANLNSGTHEAVFEGTGLSDGLYFLQLKIDGLSRAKRIILAKY